MAAEKRSRGVRARAFAKINLSLRVLGLRPDGHHELRTTFQTVALHDTLALTSIDGPFEITCNDPACPVDRTNLVWRAAEEMWRAAGRRGAVEGARVRIDKRIPIQAGLGGGSSDAAAALRAFHKLWRVKVGRDRLRRMATTLGADVPFFLEGGTALGVNRGDLVQPQADSPAAWVVLVLPDFGVSTRDAFAWWDAAMGAGTFSYGVGPHPHARRARAVGLARIKNRTSQNADRLSLTPEAESLRSRPRESEAVLASGGGAPRELRKVGPRAHEKSWRPAGTSNDLEAPVAARHPEIGEIVTALSAAGASSAAMSGSGSAVFGLFETRRGASAAAAQLKDPSRRTLVTRTLSRSKYRDLARPI